MEEYETADAISRQAAAWVARIDRAGPESRARAELDAWLAGDSRRRGAWLRAEAAWSMLDRASVLATPDRVSRDRAAPFHDLVSRRGLLMAGGVAASAAVGLAGVATLRGMAPTIITARGEIRRVPLDDGSMAVINTASRMRVNLRPDLRNVRLDEGEAWFQVARDTARPFVVAAGDVRVRAVGTAFAVHRRADGVEVQVTEGVVEAWTAGRKGAAVRVSQGGAALLSKESAPMVTRDISVRIDRTLAWRTGQIILDGDTLEAATTEFNRYNERQIVIDAGLKAERLVGRFRTNEPDAFARAAAVTLGARAEIGEGTIRISPR